MRKDTADSLGLLPYASKGMQFWYELVKKSILVSEFKESWMDNVIHLSVMHLTTD